MDEEIKSCCAKFYENDLTAFLLGRSFHPSGLELTRTLSERLKLAPEDRLLDVASGNGTSAIFIAKEFGCGVVGVDYGSENVQKSREMARLEGVENVDFRVGDAEELPFESGIFDAVISECALCTFPNKEKAASEMFRVLRVGGRVGITDVTIANEDALPEDMRDMIYRISCIADAKSIEGYETILKNAGFRNIRSERHDDALVNLVEQIKRRVFLMEMVIGLGKLDIDLEEGKRMIHRALNEIEKGTLGYALITGER